MTEPEEDLGGDPVLGVALVGAGRIADRLADDGARGLAARVAERTDGRIEVRLDHVEQPEGRSVTEVRLPADHTCAVTLLVFDHEIPDLWPGLEQARTAAAKGVAALKAAGTRIIGLGVSTVDPTQTTTKARAVERTAHELNLLLLELSVAEGISILDVDRVVAQLGAQEHLSGFLQYDDSVLDAVVSQLVDILDDYGFFERRPLLPQVGAKR